MERIDVVAYRLRLPHNYTIHLMFHVSQLRRVIGEHTSSTVLSVMLTEEMEVVLEPLEVEGGVREVRQGDEGVREVLIS